MQNNYEKRATWGFISSYAVIKTFFWKVDIEIKDSYNIWDPNPLIEPPYPLNKILSSDKFYKWWVFRDSNWSPDFKLSAFEAIKFYNKWTENPPFFDWVISLDMEFLSILLDIYWEQKFWKITFTKDNYFYKLQVLSKNIDLHNFEKLKNRKNFIKPLLKNISLKILKEPLKITKTINWMEKLANEKHFQFFFSDDNLQNKIIKKWWDWEFNPKWEDYIHLNISNIWWRKSDRYIKTLYFYDVDFTWKEPIWNLKITSKHFWTKSLISDFYQAFYRIYLPRWIEIIEKKSTFKTENKIYEELNSKVISWIVQMKPWENFEINIKYKFPKIIKNSNYNLNIIPQAWWNWENWHISVKEKTDNIWIWTWFILRDNLAFFDWKISKNKLFKIKNSWDFTPPIIAWQKFISEDLIEINFSEKISEDFLQDLSNFEIKDLNIKNEKNDNVKINKVYLRGNNLYLELWNISFQTWEYYSLILKNIHDLYWNTTEPSPLKITVVQD